MAAYKYGSSLGMRRGNSIHQDNKSHDTELAIQQATKWIEECTNTSHPDIPFRELLKDGTLLCELIQKVQPGLIKKINRSKKPFGGRENLSFFLDACRKLGLKGSQLFDAEDLQGLWTTSLHTDLRSNSSRERRDDSERKLRNVAVTIYWLGKKLHQLPGYTGPQLDLTAFQNLVSSQRRRSYSAAGRLSVSSSSSGSSSVNATPTKQVLNSSRNNSVSIEASSSKTSLVSGDHISSATTQTTSSTVVSVHSTCNGVSSRLNAVKSCSVLPLSTEATSPCSPSPAEALKEEEEITDKETDPVTPLTPLISDQQRTQFDCAVQSSNNNNNCTTEEEPLVSDIADPKELELQYTIADVGVLDSDLETTTNTFCHHSKLEDLTLPEVVDKPPVVGMYRVDTRDEVVIPNGHCAGDTPITVSSIAVTGDVSALGRLTSRELDVVVKLDTGEKRFGFSVIGGGDEGFTARVESIAAGSAASRVDLKPGDELVAMDNVPLASISHAEIIIMMQKASLNGLVVLHIKRIIPKDSSSTDDIGPSLAVIDNKEEKTDVARSGEEEDKKRNNGYVRVETKAVPTPQHPTKVVCSPDSIQQLSLMRHVDIIGDAFSDDNSMRAELGSNPDDRSISSDIGEQVEGAPTVEAEVTVDAMSSSEAIVVSSTTTCSAEENIDHGTPKGVVVLSSIAGTSSTMSVVRPRSAPHSKLRQVLPADSVNCFNTHETKPMCRHQSQKSVPDVVHPAKRELHKYTSLPARAAHLNLDRTMSEGTSDVRFTVLNSFKDSRDAIDEIWQSVTSEGDSSKTVQFDTGSSPLVTSPQLAASISSSLAVHVSDPDLSSVTVSGDRTDNVVTMTSPTEDSSGGRSVSLLQLIDEINAMVGKEEDVEDYEALKRMVQSSNFKNLMEMCAAMRQLLGHDPQPVDKHTTLTALLVRKKVREQNDPSRDMLDLRALLQDPDVQAVLFCHDCVATGDLVVSDADAGPYNNITDTASSYSQDTEGSSDGLLVTTVDPILRSSTINLDAWDRRDLATIVCIKKTEKSLGATIYKNGESVYVGHLLKGCDAEQSGVLHEGDELLEINGIPVVGMSTEQIVKLMSGLGGAQLSLTIIKAGKIGDTGLSELVYVRAYFDYNPLEDGYIPCRDLGLPFSRGDILEIINHDDPNWWQARRVDQLDSDSQPGLIPAKHMQERREALRTSHPGGFYQRHRRKGLLHKMKKKKKVFYSSQFGSEGLSVGDEVLTYEEVVRLQPEERLKRPIVLIGAPGVGKTTLQKMLIERYPDRYAYCVPFTSRPMKPGEVSGQDYHFISRDQIEKEINANKFVEYKEVKGYYYGTHMASVSNVLLAGKSPILELQSPQSLKLLRNKTLMPYVIFVAAPSIEQLYSIRIGSLDRSVKKKRSSEGDISADELEQLFWTSQQIEIHYAPYFDSTVVNDDLSVSFDLMAEVVEKIEQEPQWVPSSWVQQNGASWVLIYPANR